MSNGEETAAERATLQAEAAKYREEAITLRVERDALRDDLRRPWLIRIATPVLVTMLASGLGGYLFGDSLLERNRAEIRTEVLKLYFGVENEEVGKRKQMLSFVRTVLAKDDCELEAWVNEEQQVVDGGLNVIRSKIVAIEGELAELRTEETKARSIDTPILVEPSPPAPVHKSDPRKDPVGRIREDFRRLSAEVANGNQLDPAEVGRSLGELASLEGPLPDQRRDARQEQVRRLTDELLGLRALEARNEIWSGSMGESDEAAKAKAPDANDATSPADSATASATAPPPELTSGTPP